MSDILILTAPTGETQSAFYQLAVQSLQQAILTHQQESQSGVKIVAIDELTPNHPSLRSQPQQIYPMTLTLPQWLDLSPIYAACRDLAQLQQQVATWDIAIQPGDTWLPIVWTTKGPLYGELIGQAEDGSYRQPIHLRDTQRQPLYQLGQRLLRSLAAPPSVYLMQVAIAEDHISFDQLWPFPSSPAVASLCRQTPDLFICHWRCLTSQPIRELTILPSA